MPSTTRAMATIVKMPKCASPVASPANWKMTSATQYASPHSQPMALQVHFALFISRLMAPIAAKQGAQRRLKARKL